MQPSAARPPSARGVVPPAALRSRGAAPARRVAAAARRGAAAARRGAADAPPTPTTLADRARELIDTPAYRVYLPIAIGLGLAAFVDAAYSGDWARVGALTLEQEAALRQPAALALGAHATEGAIAGAISFRRGEARWPLRMAKGFAGGATTILEVILLPDADADV
jgi:hypothetical protein